MRTQPLLLVLALSACTDTNDNYDPGAKYGEFGDGAFLYRCVVDGDPTCRGSVGTAPNFPAALALGRQMDLEYTWQDDPDTYEDDNDHYGEPLPVLQSATSARLRDDGSRFVALATGFVAVIAVDGNSHVVELVHFEIAEVDAVRAITSPAEDFPVAQQQLDMREAEERELQGLVVDLHGRELGGILPYSWTSEDPSVLEIVSGGDSGLVHLRAGNVGTTNLVLTQGEHTLTLPVTVEVGNGSASDASTGGSSGATDTTADTDTTAGTGTTADTDTTAGTTADTDTTAGSTGTTGGVL